MAQFDEELRIADVYAEALFELATERRLVRKRATNLTNCASSGSSSPSS